MEMIQSSWIGLAQHYLGVQVDEFIVMPNHVHGIIVLTVGAGPRACPDSNCANKAAFSWQVMATELL
jgi:hypothetical protein